MEQRQAAWGARIGAAACVAALLLACGGESTIDTAEASGARMQALESGVEHAAGTGPARRFEVAPRIERVHFDPPYPKTGDRVRAIVELADGHEPGHPGGAETGIVIEHLWTVGGVLQAGRGPELLLSRSQKGDVIEVRVSTRQGSARGEAVVASTYIDNSAPVLQSLRMDPERGLVANSEVTAVAVATDRDSDTLTFRYNWRVNGISVPEDGPTLSTADLRRGDRVVVSVFASDDEDDSDSLEAPEITLENAFPVIVSDPAQAGADGVFRYRPRAEDPDGDRSLRFSLASAPPGMTIRSVDGNIEWRPSAKHAGTHVIEIVVEDSEGGHSSQRFEMVIEPPEETPPPASQ